MQGLAAALHALSSGQYGFQKFEQPPTQPPFNRFMAKMMLKSTVTTVDEKERTPGALIDSGAIDHFLRHSCSFIVYTVMNPEQFKGAVGLSTVVGKGLVKLATGPDGLVVRLEHLQCSRCSLFRVQLRNPLLCFA